MNVTLVAAMDRNRGIGIEGRLPWNLPEDLAHFRALTMGATVLMGRKTFQSIGRPLPGRRNLVVTRTEFRIPGVTTCHSLGNALITAGEGPLFVIGGGEIYRSMLPAADRIVLTVVNGVHQCDTFFPLLGAAWRKVATRPIEGAVIETYSKS